MRCVTISILACTLATITSTTSAAGQSRTPLRSPAESRSSRANPLGLLLEGQPRLVVYPMGALLGDGTFEQRLNARATWPADDTVPDFSLHLLAGIASGREAHSRSGLRIDLAHEVGRIHLTSSASLAVGSGAGPHRSALLTFGAGIPALWIELRTTWLGGGANQSFRTIGDDESISGLPRPTNSLAGNYTDGEVNAMRRMGPVRFQIIGGQRFGGDRHGTRQWLLGEADIPMPRWRRFGIVLAGGIRPERADLGQPGGRFAQLGLRLNFGSPDVSRSAPTSVPTTIPAPGSGPETMSPPSVLPLDRDHYLVRLSVPGGNRVELKGDITDWTVIPLCRSTAGHDLWETSIHKPAGFYQVNIRVDGGEWIVPPGLVAIPDRFGGLTGILNLPVSVEANDEV